MVYEQPDDVTPVRMNQSRHFQQRGSSPVRGDQRSGDQRSGGRGSEDSYEGDGGTAGHTDLERSLARSQETCRFRLSF
jgi:hypothetical protein